jgi:hypothetical protein
MFFNRESTCLLFPYIFSKDMRQHEIKRLQKASTKPDINANHTGQHPRENVWNDTLCKTKFLMNPLLQNTKKCKQTILALEMIC